MVRGALFASLALPSACFVPLAVPGERTTEQGTNWVNGFEQGCRSTENRGWPRFNSLQELTASNWSRYFLEIYGELPANFPVCIYDFHYLNVDALEKSRIGGLSPSTVSADLPDGSLIATDFPLNGAIQFLIYHEHYEPAPANSWIEISHTAFPSEETGLWAFRLRGTGVWFNTGDTKVFPTPADHTLVHKDAMDYLTDGCSRTVSKWWPRYESDVFGHCAREKGLDSIQFEPTEGAKPTGVFGMAGLTEIVITGLDGQFSCGTEDASKTSLRSGWRASATCDCENTPMDESCGLMARPRFPLNLPFATDPPICERQRRQFWKDCKPETCSWTACKRMPIVI